MLAPRRLLMTTDAVGGVWRYALDLAQGLAAQGVETTLLGFGPKPDAGQTDEARRVARLRWSHLPLDWMAGGPDALQPVPDEIARAASECRAEVVQVNVPSQAAGLRLDIPVVAASHSCVATWFRTVRGTDLPLDWQWQRQFTYEGLRAAETVLAPTHAHARAVARCYPGIGPVSVVPNATSLASASDAKRPYAYAAARWWDEGKNAGTLDAAAELLDVPVHAAGATEGPDGQAFRFRHARRPGRLDRARLLDLARSAAVFVSPSRYEPFGLAALEAARLGAALVLADIPSYREIWDGAAHFADADDPTAFARVTRKLMGDADLRATLGACAAARSARFSTGAQANHMLALYRRAAVRREPARAV